MGNLQLEFHNFVRLIIFFKSIMCIIQYNFDSKDGRVSYINCNTKNCGFKVRIAKYLRPWQSLAYNGDRYIFLGHTLGNDINSLYFAE